MACDTKLKPNQTISQRAAEVRGVVERVALALSSGAVKPRIGPQGSITFVGITDEQRDGVTDACIYRRVMASSNALAKAKIAQAEAIYGRGVNRQTVAQGVHSHDGGTTWHKH